jgi:hypothetical protein
MMTTRGFSLPRLLAGLFLNKTALEVPFQAPCGFHLVFRTAIVALDRVLTLDNRIILPSVGYVRDAVHE